MSSDRLVAIADILGFKRTILQTPLKTVVEKYFDYFRKALQHSFELQGWPVEADNFEKFKSRLGIGMEWFSDTLLLYTRDDSDDAIRNLMQGLTWLVFETMYFHAVRLRVGIDYGELHVDPNAGQFVGRAMVCAYELERNQSWAGGALTAAATARLTHAARFYTVSYAVPLKKDDPPSNTALNWTLGVHLGFNMPFRPDRKEPNAADDPGVIEKWSNTIAFHNNVCVSCARSTR